MSNKIRPTRKAKSGKNGFYEFETGCGKLAITIHDGEDNYPVRVIVEPKGQGGCQGGIEYLRRSLTYCLESNLDISFFLEEVCDKIICPSAKQKMIRENKKDIKLSCARAVSDALKSHLNCLKGSDEK